MMIKLHQCQSIQTVHWPLLIISLTGLRLAISWSVAKDFFYRKWFQMLSDDDQIASMSVHATFSSVQRRNDDRWTTSVYGRPPISRPWRVELTHFRFRFCVGKSSFRFSHTWGLHSGVTFCQRNSTHHISKRAKYEIDRKTDRFLPNFAILL